MPHGEQLTAAGSNGISKGVLVAISIPIFTSQLEKSKEATDMANIRAAYAEVTTQYLEDTAAHTATVEARQAKAGWESADNHTLTTRVDGTESEIIVADYEVGKNFSVAIDADGTVTVSLVA